MNQDDGKEHSHEGRRGYQGFQIFVRMKIADSNEKAKGLRAGGKQSLETATHQVAVVSPAGDICFGKGGIFLHYGGFLFVESLWRRRGRPGINLN